MNDPEKNTPSSIMDIVSCGYKMAFRTLLPISILCLPYLVLFLAGSIWIELAISNSQDSNTKEQLYNLLRLPLCYWNYVIARYVCDVLQDKVRKNLASYLCPGSTFLGVIGIGIITIVYGIGYGIAALLGLLLLVIPGLAVISYYHMMCGMLYIDYLLNPQDGIWAVRKRVAFMLKGQFLRTAALGGIACLVMIVALLPLFIIDMVKVFIEEQAVSVMHSAPFLAAYGCFMTLTEWFTLAFGFAGYCYILNYYWHDLRIREEQANSRVIDLDQVRTQSRTDASQQDAI
jgi:hypothetical protein